MSHNVHARYQYAYVQLNVNIYATPMTVLRRLWRVLSKKAKTRACRRERHVILREMLRCHAEAYAAQMRAVSRGRR